MFGNPFQNLQDFPNRMADTCSDIENLEMLSLKQALDDRANHIIYMDIIPDRLFGTEDLDFPPFENPRNRDADESLPTLRRED